MRMTVFKCGERHGLHVLQHQGVRLPYDSRTSKHPVLCEVHVADHGSICQRYQKIVGIMGC